MANKTERVKIKLAGQSIDILRERFPGEVPPEARQCSYNVNRYVMDLIIEDYERGKVLLSEIQ